MLEVPQTPHVSLEVGLRATAKSGKTVPFQQRSNHEKGRPRQFFHLGYHQKKGYQQEQMGVKGLSVTIKFLFGILLNPLGKYL
jgi:hypothetical protein